MTRQEILEAEKLITGMRDDLTAMASTTDEDKLVNLVRDKVPPMGTNTFCQLVKHLESSFGHDFIFQKVADRDLTLLGLLLCDASSGDEYKKTLVARVAKYVPEIIADLNEISFKLRVP